MARLPAGSLASGHAERLAALRKAVSPDPALAEAHAAKEAAQAAADVKRAWPFFTIDAFIRQFLRDADRALVVQGLREAGLE